MFVFLFKCSTQLAEKRSSRKFARFVLFRPIKKRSFNLLFVLDLFFRTLAVNSVSVFHKYSISKMLRLTYKYSILPTTASSLKCFVFEPVWPGSKALDCQERSVFESASGLLSLPNVVYGLCLVTVYGHCLVTLPPPQLTIF